MVIIERLKLILEGHQHEAVNRANRLIKQAEERLAAGSNARLNTAIADLGVALPLLIPIEFAKKPTSSNGLCLRLRTFFSTIHLTCTLVDRRQPRPKRNNSALERRKQRSRISCREHCPRVGKNLRRWRTLDPQLCRR